LANALVIASAQRCTSTPLALAMEVVAPWSAPAGPNTFDGATNWVPQPGLHADFLARATRALASINA